MKFAHRAGIALLALAVFCAITGLYPEVDQEIAKIISFIAFVVGAFALVLDGD